MNLCNKWLKLGVFCIFTSQLWLKPGFRSTLPFLCRKFRLKLGVFNDFVTTESTKT